MYINNLRSTLLVFARRNARILITNYRKLEMLTTRLPDVELFGGTPLNAKRFDSFTGRRFDIALDVMGDQPSTDAS